MGQENMNSEQVEKVKRYFNVIVEGLGNEIHRVAEGHDVIRQEMKEFCEEVKEETLRIANRKLRIYNSTIPNSKFTIRNPNSGADRGSVVMRL